MSMRWEIAAPLRPLPEAVEWLADILTGWDGECSQRDAIARALANEREAAEARGREAGRREALGEVDAAVERIGDWGDVTLRAEGGGWTVFRDREVIDGRTTPTAAIVAAAAALDADAGVDDGD